jgi:hypothetical protein
MWPFKMGTCTPPPGESFSASIRPRLRWQNPLKGLGRGLITIATANGQQTLVMREKKQRDEAATAGVFGAAT